MRAVNIKMNRTGNQQEKMVLCENRGYTYPDYKHTVDKLEFLMSMARFY